MSMKVTMPRYELQPVTMARWRTAGRAAAYSWPCPRRGSGTSASNPSNGANAVTATSESVAVPGVRHKPIRESAFRAALSFRAAGVAARTHSPHPSALNSPASRTEFDVRRQAGVHQALGLGDRPLVKARDPFRKRLDVGVELGVGNGSVYVAVGLSPVAADVFRAQQHLQGPVAADKPWQTRHRAAAGNHAHANLSLRND